MTTRTKTPHVELQREPERKTTGPSNVFFRPKDHPPISLTMTKLGKGILRSAAKRTGRSHADVVEQLLRQHGASVTFE